MGQTPSDDSDNNPDDGEQYDNRSPEDPDNQQDSKIGDDGDDGGGDGDGPRPSAGSPTFMAPPGALLSEQVKDLVQDDVPPVHTAVPQAKPPEYVLTQFKWNHGGEDIYVTGSFNDWQGKIRMNPNENGEFTLELKIPTGFHQYKYIVDGEWQLNPDAPTIEDDGVINNVVEVKRGVIDLEIPCANSDDEGDVDEMGRKVMYAQKARIAEGKVPKMPPHLKFPLLDAPPPPPPADRFALPIPDHVMVNHLFLYEPAKPDQQDVQVTAITQRFKTKPFASLRSKFVTTVYYAPRVEEKDPILVAAAE